MNAPDASAGADHPCGDIDWTPLRAAFPAWATPDSGLFALLDARFAATAHGDMGRWQGALAALPPLPVEHVRFGATVTVSGPASVAARAALEAALGVLHPWRKGPYALFGVHIDTEWRSDWKWLRVATHLGPLTGQRILDVGSGNGYFGWRMLEAGAELVVGVDPTLLFCMQHRAVNCYIGSAHNWVLPLAFEEFPVTPFDTVFSMGVVYHRRDPLAHVLRLAHCVRPGGTLVLESLVVTEGPDLQDLPRYARMRNVHMVPGVATLVRWLEAAGLTDVRIADVTRTTPEEQRTTSWMRFESLADALDQADPRFTIEGHPAPVRAIVLGRKPV